MNELNSRMFILLERIAIEREVRRACGRQIGKTSVIRLEGILHAIRTSILIVGRGDVVQEPAPYTASGGLG